MEIKIKLKPSSALDQFDFDQFQFGKAATDHMLVADYADGAWQSAEISGFESLSLSPLSMCLHYGQTVFEGLKAYRQVDGSISIFRLEGHWERMNQSLRRMAMPELPAGLFIAGIKKLVEVDQDWVIDREGFSLYLRPFMIATEERLGVSISREYKFMVVASPLAAYYSAPLKVKVEKHYTRACPGGAGMAKNGGNYGASYYPAYLAQQEGYDQVMWTNSRDHEYLEESGTMNLMFIIDGILLTPPTGETVLAGLTRDSLLQVAKDMNWSCEVRPIAIKELQQAFEGGKRVEAFGVGTAAVLTPFKLIHMEGEDYFPYVEEDAKMYLLKKKLSDIRLGREVDPYGWSSLIEVDLVK